MSQTSNTSSPQMVLGYHAGIANVPPGWTNVSSHGIRPELAYLQWRRNVGILMTLWVPLFVAAMAFCAWAMRDNRHRQMLALTIASAFMISAMALRLFRTRRQFNKRWPTFRIIMSDQGIMRASEGLNDLVIPFQEISSVKESRAGIVVGGRRRVDLILIPATLEDYDSIRSRLAVVRMIGQGAHRGTTLAIGVYFVLLAGYFTGMSTSSHELRWAMIVLLMAIAIWTMVQNLSSPNTTPRQKFLAPVVLVFPLCLLLMEMLPAIWRSLFP